MNGKIRETVPARARGLSWRVPCRVRPERWLGGPSRSFLLTEAGEWFAVSPAGVVEAIEPELSPCSAALVDGRGNLQVGLFHDTVARLRGRQWEHQVRTSAVLSLALVQLGLAVGEAGGRVTLLADTGDAAARNSAPILKGVAPADASEWRGDAAAPLEVGEPVIDLAATDDGLLAIAGGRGSLLLTRWPATTHLPVERVDTAALGRPFAFVGAPPGDRGHLFVMSAHRVAALDGYRARIELSSESFPEGLRQVVALGWTPPAFAALTDTGDLWILDARLGRRRLPLPSDVGEVAGIARAERGDLLAWTPKGELLRVGQTGSDRGITRVAASGIVVAGAAPGLAPGGFVAVSWSAGEGAVVEGHVSSSSGGGGF